MRHFQHETAIVDEGAEIGPDSRVWHFAHVCGGARIGAGVSLGQNVFVGNKVTIGAFIAAGAVVTKDVPDFALMVGVPSRQIGWMSAYGEQLDLPLKGDAETICPETGALYRLSAGQLHMEEAP